MRKLLVLSAALVVCGFAANATEPPPQAASAEILNEQGEVIGTAEFKQGSIGVLANISIEKGSLPPGPHGFHLHAVGTCDHMDHFKSASGHINPDEKSHGYLNADGPDKGDLPNLIVHEDGGVNVELFMPQVDVYGDGNSPRLLDSDGTSLMIHANPDDHTTQPIGGAGERIACGVIKVK